MYLKEIEVSGFKSFADKLQITLDDNITCIVGPNGSGKSNVVDAVRWVLGEQSVKSLRGDGTMSDVIFSGSKTRKPLHVASVALTFDNRDHYLNLPYTEVSVKRRCYRTGENEYFINGEKCRLKDITDLFLDSGIGKESFNIISQGEVQKILSSSPQDRRSIFEEAAGVLKYKKRKEEALRKLERTHDNLNRVEDILQELSQQLEPLKEQSEKAKQYLESKKKLEKHEVSYLVYRIETMNHTYQQDQMRLEELKEKRLGLVNSQNNSKIERLKADLLKIEADLASLQQELLTLTKEEEQLNSKKKLFQERSKYHAEDLQVHENLLYLTEQKSKQEANQSVIESKLKELEEEQTRARNQVNQEMMAYQSLKDKITSIDKERTFHEQQQMSLEHQIHILETSLNELQGVPNSVRSILLNPKLTGIHQMIGSLFEVKETYVKAIDVALGASKQFIVVDNVQTAKNAISYLKEKHLGRATFFPLNVIKPKGIDYDTMSLVMKEEGYIDIASNLIQYDETYRNIFQNQLGNVLVVDNIDHATQLSKKIHARYRIVTLDGEIVHVGGSMTGGSLQTARSMVSEKVELAKKKDQVQMEKGTIAELKQEQETLKQHHQQQEEKLYQQRANLYLLEEEIAKQKQELVAITEQLQELNQEWNTLQHVVDQSLNKEEEKVIQAFYDKKSEKEKKIQEIDFKQKEENRLQQALDEMEALEKENNSKVRNLENEIKEKEVSVAKLDVELDHILQTLTEEYEMSFEAAKQKYVLEMDPEDAKREIVSLRSIIKQMGMVNIAAIEEYERIDARYTFLNGQKEDLLKAKDTLLEIIEEMDDVMKEEFMATFQKVEKEFKQVFTQLFRGGSASLKLTDPNDLLTTGVEIIASPPGKKLTTISLLSGGEKTLTAISLLFAILNIRTVPFCLFDEVEAALDEANVDQFGKYLDHYKEKTQFLLITHKKKTMEYANTLYGITMQESGVSKLVSVRLDEVEKENESNH